MTSIAPHSALRDSSFPAVLGAVSAACAGHYRKPLREEIRQTLSDASQVAEEMRTLFGAFS